MWKWRSRHEELRQGQMSKQFAEREYGIKDPRVRERERERQGEKMIIQEPREESKRILSETEDKGDGVMITSYHISQTSYTSSCSHSKTFFFYPFQIFFHNNIRGADARQCQPALFFYFCLFISLFIYLFIWSLFRVADTMHRLMLMPLTNGSD